MAAWRPKQPHHVTTIICEPWMDQSHPHSSSGADPPDIDPFVTDEPLFSDFLYEPDGPINLPRPHLSGLQKKQNQWRRWSQEVVPSLIKPYLAYCRRSESLQSNPDLGLLTGDNLRCSAFCRLRSLAVTCVLFDLDIRVLELVKNLFVRMTPNSTAWCDALENFLNERGYKLNTKDSLRRRFSNAYHWYTVLTIMSSDYLTTFISNSRRAGADSVASHETPGIPQVLSQPSAYLSSRCPLCFGGNDWHQHCDPDTTVDCIVCVDACFTQKRSNNPRNGGNQDPPNPTPTVFIPECDVKMMEDHVRDCRGGGAGTRKRPRQLAEEIYDGYEDGMRIPVSVLDGCSKSFVAADEKRKKQLERSCRKWSLLDDSILSRISFRISVFHAYGHQWPCQIVYHPRKRAGFGLSDGEGCEHLWSALKQLIPVLRVSGYHQQLFVLDVQVHHLALKSLDALGQWLARKWMLCQQKKKAALEGLRDLAFDEDFL
ncbi:hypothetical protein EV702DRAFT_1046312 [Suillus placidus]|uniref:CxC1-like cysteine cluster associated with KDZ transposases domain-containing protein n=1 Tax=Suillus placidus TaxID=48579 RepID=A0A9P6ZTY8_9AGAM|nr:hypothetical protein EV702DRAFT_1046312 [Suillus placidus]